jgi:hypothetical protein
MHLTRAPCFVPPGPEVIPCRATPSLISTKSFVGSHRCNAARQFVDVGCPASLRAPLRLLAATGKCPAFGGTTPAHTPAHPAPQCDYYMSLVFPSSADPHTITAFLQKPQSPSSLLSHSLQLHSLNSHSLLHIITLISQHAEYSLDLGRPCWLGLRLDLSQLREFSWDL